MLERFVQGADGTTVFVTIDGDQVDQIAHAYFGKHAGTAELVLDINPGLAAKGLILPAGTVIRMPPRPSATVTPKPTRKLWD